MTGFQRIRGQAAEAGNTHALRVYWCEGWDAESQEVRGAAVLMGSTDDPREAVDIGCMESGHYYRRYGPGEVITLDSRGRRVDPYRLTVRQLPPPVLADSADGIDLGNVEFVDA